MASVETNPTQIHCVGAADHLFKIAYYWKYTQGESVVWTTGKKSSRVAKSRRLRGEDRCRHHSKSGGVRSPRRVRRGGLEASVSVAGAAQKPRTCSRCGILIAVMGQKQFPKWSMSSEQVLRLAARAVNMTAEDARLQAELAPRRARQHGSWTERWPCHVDGAVYIVSLYIASYVYFVLTGIAYSSSRSSRYQVPGFPPGCLHMRSVPGPEPVSCALELPRPEPEPSSLDSEMDDRLLLAKLTRSSERASASLGCKCSICWYTQQQRFPGTYPCKCII